MPSLGHQLAVNLDEMRKIAREGVDQTWTKADAEVIAFLSRRAKTPIYLRIRRGGRYWDRTSDPCVVSAVLSR